jgi:hypothetical protein
MSGAWSLGGHKTKFNTIEQDIVNLCAWIPGALAQ